MTDSTLSHAFLELLEKLLFLREHQWLRTDSTGSGAHGEALEFALGIDRNCDKKPDFHGVELKATTERKPKIRDLLTLAPSKSHPSIVPLSRMNLILTAGYKDEQGRPALKVAVSSTPNAQKLRLAVDDDWIVELHDNVPVSAWSLRSLQDALKAKHSETCWIVCITETLNTDRYILPVGWMRTASIKTEAITGLISTGLITVDHRLHLESKANGGSTVRDRGDQWRFRGDVTDLFEEFGPYTLLGDADTPYPTLNGHNTVPRFVSQEQLPLEFPAPNTENRPTFG